MMAMSWPRPTYPSAINAFACTRWLSALSWASTAWTAMPSMFAAPSAICAIVRPARQLNLPSLSFEANAAIAGVLPESAMLGRTSIAFLATLEFPAQSGPPGRTIALIAQSSPGSAMSFNVSRAHLRSSCSCVSSPMLSTTAFMASPAPCFASFSSLKKATSRLMGRWQCSSSSKAAGTSAGRSAEAWPRLVRRRARIAAGLAHSEANRHSISGSSALGGPGAAPEAAPAIGASPSRAAPGGQGHENRYPGP
mmetsp:Transcript_24624/g.58484  ORF Transcript_24624/g.58484 Transcript_24624/m.58484 type:complete len:252 (-) Transcript_24624:7-762(-)